MEAKQFGEFIRGLRKRKNMTIRQLELYSGVSNSYLSQLENGKRGIPSPVIIKKLHKPLGISYEELMEKAGYLNSNADESGENPSTSVDEEIENLIKDPDFMIAYKEMPGSPEEAKEELIRFMRYLKYEEDKKKRK